MPQANNPTPDTSDPDMQEALAAYQAYKADQAQRAQNIAHPTPDAADKAAQGGKPTLDPEWKAQQDYYKQERQQPWTTQAKHILLGDSNDPMQKAQIGLGAAGLTLPAGAAPPAIQALSDYLKGGGITAKLGRVGANAALGYSTGGVKGAVMGGLFGAAGEGVADMANATGKVAAYGGGTMANMTPEETKAYVRNPELAEEVYGQAKKDPSGFMGGLYGKLKEAAARLQEGYIDPRMAEISSGGVGKSYRVNPDQFQGTEAGKVIQDSWNKQGNTLDVPLYERTETPTFEARATESYTNPQTQSYSTVAPTQVDIGDVPIGPQGVNRGRQMQVQSDVNRANLAHVNSLFDPYGKQPTTEVSQVERGWDILPGSPQTTLTKAAPQQIPAPPPESMTIGTEPLLRAKRASSAAADLIGGRNPNNVTVPDQAQAQRESQAATDLATALHNQDPRSAQLDQEVSEAIRYKNQALEQGNPAKVLTNTDALGNLPSRATQDYLDTNTGSNFRDLADAYSAGKAINAPNKVHGWIDRLAVVPAGRALVRSAPSLFGASQALQSTYPLMDQRLLHSMFGDNQ